MIRAEFDRPWRQDYHLDLGPAPYLILGDPASLYVCSDAANREDEYTMRRSVWQATLWNTTVVTGSTAPRLDPEHLTMVAVRELRQDHLTAPVGTIGDALDHLDDPEFDYHADAYMALCDVISEDRAPWRAR